MSTVRARVCRWVAVVLLPVGLAGCGFGLDFQPRHSPPGHFDEPVPDAVHTAQRFARIGLGGRCMLNGAGEAWCWGPNTLGVLGTAPEVCNPEMVDPCAWEPQRVAGVPPLVEVVAGLFSTCGLTAAGQAWCWGATYLGDGGGYQYQFHAPVAVAGGHVFTQLTGGVGAAVCGLDADGRLWCWGHEDDPEFALPVDGASTPIVWAAASSVAFASVSLGGAHACGLDASGHAWCWGRGGAGQLGDGSLADATAPVPVAGGRVFRQIAAGSEHSCALEPDGRAWCWGNGAALGDGVGARSGVPVPVVGDHAFRQLDVTGWLSTCAVALDGRAWCWGGNEHGALGSGQRLGGSLVPIAVIGGDRFSAISANSGATCGIAEAGVAVCWGANALGQVGRPPHSHPLAAWPMPD